MVRASLILCFLTFSAPLQAQSALKILKIKPTGENVPVQKQIVFTFDQKVVPVGKMDRDVSEIPIRIEPELKCQWRWLDTSNLSCELTEENATQYATAYKITISPGIKNTEGVEMSGTHTHTFSTERPRLTYSHFEEWKGPGHPLIDLTFNQPVGKASVERSLKLLVGGRIIPVIISKDEDRRLNPRYVKAPGEKFFVDLGPQQLISKDDQPKEYKGDVARRNWQLEPGEDLPLDAPIELHVEPGLESALGELKGDQDKLEKSFYTFPEFAFLGVTCWDQENNKIFLPVGQSLGNTMCNPLSSIRLTFSAPVMEKEVKDGFRFTPALNAGKEDYDPWGEVSEHSSVYSPHKKDRHYFVSLPGNLKAYQVYETKGTLKDEFGRGLSSPVQFKFKTNHRSPDLKLTYSNSVVEKDLKNDIPIFITNLNSLHLSYKTLSKTSRPWKTSEVEVKKIQDVAYGHPMKLPELLQGDSGLVFGSISSRELPGKRPVEFLAQVTNYQVFAKMGHFNSLVWVTDMRTGQPVDSAEVVLYKDSYETLAGPGSPVETGKTDAQGLARMEGYQKWDPLLQILSDWYFRNEDNRFFVRIKKGNELAFLPLDSNYRISESWGDLRKVYGHIKAWGMTPQGIYRAGQKIEYKIWVRNQDNKKLVTPPPGPYHLEVTDPTGKKVYSKDDIRLSAFGSFHGEFQTTEQSAVGWYNFKLTLDETSYAFYPLKVLVADFTPAPFRVKTEIQGDIFSRKDSLKVATSASLHSGGPYRDANARVTATLIPQAFQSSHPKLKKFYFGNQENYYSSKFFENQAAVNAEGKLQKTIALKSLDEPYGRIRVESSVQDDRGKFISSRSVVKFHGVDRFMGLKNTHWTYKQQDGMSIEAAVANPEGKPLSGVPFEVELQWREYKVVRVKSSGNSFRTKTEVNWVKEGNCKKTSSVAPSRCSFKPAHTGSYKIIGKVKDKSGREHSSELWAWVVGPGRTTWDDNNTHQIDVVPEETKVNVGDTARFLIKNPFEKAEALIVVERFGEIESFTKTFTSSTPVFELKIKPEHVPGFYLSVVLTSPRVSGKKDLGELDLGKPSMRYGNVQMNVVDPYKELVITASTDKEVYKPRDKVELKIKAEPRNKRGFTEAKEVAIAVLDEAVFDLIQGGEKNYDPYQGFYKLDSRDSVSFSTLMKLVGQQKFMEKGASPGGGGGEGLSIRNVFKYLTYWNPSLKLNEKNEGQVSFDLPDNLTGWRVLVLGTTPTELMGLGQTDFKVNQKTEIRPALPNQVTEGDEFKARFTVMNRTKKVRKVTVSMMASGDVKGSLESNTHKKTVTLKPFVRENLEFTLTSAILKQDRNSKKGQIKIQVIARDSLDKDGLVHYVPVNKRRSLLVGAQYGSADKNEVSEKVKIPENIYADVGEISLTSSATVLGNVDGAFAYMRDYPYICWEQKLSKASMASHYNKLKKYFDKDFKWEESRTLPQKTLEMASGYQAPNGGMSYFIASNEYVSPYLSAFTALAFHWMRRDGHKVPESVEEKLQTYLQNLIRKNVFPSWYSPGMNSTVRAVALAALAQSNKINPGDLQRYSRFVQNMSLFGKAHYLLAALHINDMQEAQKVAQVILATSVQSGGKYSFNEVLDDSYVRILSTPLRANCAILSSFVEMAKTPAGRRLVGDVPFRLVRFITQSRGNRHYFENTQENMFCMNALIDYSKTYESKEPDMKLQAFINGSKWQEGSLKGLKSAPLTFVRPIEKADIGKDKEIKMTREGVGRFYYTTLVKYAPLDEFSKRHNAGIDLRKELSVEKDGKMVLLKKGDKIKRGDIVRVDIYASLPTARNFVVIDDPVPGALEPVNTQLKTASVGDAEKSKFQYAGESWYFKFNNWHYYNSHRWSFYHQELRHDAVRFYSDYLPPGNYHVSYTAQAIATGEFAMMPIHAEEMYDPDVFGKGLSGRMTVVE